MANGGGDWEWPDCVNLGISSYSKPGDPSPHIPEQSLVHGVDVNSLMSSLPFLRPNGQMANGNCSIIFLHHTIVPTEERS